MTVLSTVSKVSYSGNGATTIFAVPFYFLADSHLLVVLRSAAGVETVQALTTNYTVSGAGELTGGSVTMLVAPAAGTTLVITRDVPLTQDMDLLPNDRLPADTLEESVDKLTMIAQQLNNVTSQSIKFPTSDSSSISSTLPTSSERANKYLRFGASGEPTAATIIADITATAADLSSTGSSINTVDKVTGRLVWDSTNNQLVRASGSAPSSAWVVVGGPGTPVTPEFAGNVEIGGDIIDPNGNELLGLTYVASAVNELRVVNAITTAAPELRASGSDTNIGITLTPKGSGTVKIGANNVLFATGALGTPASGTLTNCTGLPIGGVSGLGAGVATFLTTPSSDNLRSALTDETGTGVAVFNVNPTIDGATFTGNAQTTPFAASVSSGTLTINCNESNVFTVTMGENVTTLTLSNPSVGQTINVVLTQDATGNRTMSWPASFKWPSGSAGVLSTAGNSIDILVATYVGTTWYASLLKAFA